PVPRSPPARRKLRSYPRRITMRLEVGTIHVRDVEIGRATALSDHTLVIEPEELRTLVLEDSHFADVQVPLVKPGESIRVIHVLDVVEPCWKVAGPGGVFPGFVSPALTVGEGRTHRLAGVAVVEVGAPVPGESAVFRQRLIDMDGPGAELSPFGRTLNVALEFIPNMACFPPGSEQIKDFLTGGPESHEYNRAVLTAGLKVAARLGHTAREAPPDDIETFELAPSDPARPPGGRGARGRPEWLEPRGRSHADHPEVRACRDQDRARLQRCRRGPRRSRVHLRRSGGRRDRERGEPGPESDAAEDGKADRRR